MEVILEVTEVLIFMEATEGIKQVHDLHLEVVLEVESEVVAEAPEEVVEAFVEVLQEDHLTGGELVSNSCNKSSYTFCRDVKKRGETEQNRAMQVCKRIQKYTSFFLNVSHHVMVLIESKSHIITIFENYSKCRI